MFSETYFGAQFSTKMTSFFFPNAVATLETAEQRQSTAQVTVHLSNEGSVHDNREAVLILYQNIPPKSTDYSWNPRYYPRCWIIKPGRHEKTSTCPCDRLFSGPMRLGLGGFNVYLP